MKKCDRRTCDVVAELLGYASDRVLGKTKVSPNFQIALVSEVRPWLPAQPGEYLQYRKLRNGMIIIEPVKVG